MVNLYDIKVNTADVTAGQSIAAYLTDAAGALITSTLVGGAQAADVNVVQSALPTGAATEATLVAIESDLNDIKHLDGDPWFAGSFGVESLAVRHDASGPLSGVADGDWSPLQVDANGALKVAASVTIGDNHAEDSAASSGDIGSFSLLVRQDTLATSTSADGDYGAFKSNAAGELYVHDTSALAELVLIKGDTASIVTSSATTATNTGTIAASIASLSKIEDDPHVSGDAGIQSLAVRNDAGGSLADTDGDYAPLQVDANGALRISGSVSVTLTAQHNEDAPAASGDSGIFSLLVRQDTLASSTSADGDYGAFKSNAAGELYVHDTAALAELVLIKGDTAAIAASTASIDTKSTTIASNTGTTATTLTALSKAEDAVAASGDQGIQALAVRKDAQGSNVNADGDYSSLQTWSEGSLKVVDVANGAILQQQVAVSTTAAQVPAANLASRKTLMIQNTGSSKVWIGSATLTSSGAAAGLELPANSFMELECGPAVAVYAKTNAGSGQLNLLELA